MAAILVVDDHSTSQRLMSFILQQNGHQPVTAINGRHALERLAEQPFDLVITDLNMPELDGSALVEQMRADARYRGIPVVVLTGSVHDQDGLRAYFGKSMALLTKPVGSDEVMATVTRLLAAAKAADAAGDQPAAVTQSESSGDGPSFMGLRLKQKIHVI
jgi:CheY-like chemotaxis protein